MNIPKLDIKKLRLKDINWQKYSRVAVGVMILLAFGYVGVLIRGSQTTEPDKAYLDAKLREFNQANLKVNQDQLNALDAKSETSAAGRNPFNR